MNNNTQPIDITKTLNFIDDTYDNLSYFDLYGNSVILFIFITLIVFVVFSYCKIMQTKEDIANDWVNQRCKPQNMLFAGFITHPEGTTAFQYTSDNFQYCVQDILKNISGYALEPFQFMIKALTQVFTQMSNSIQQSRETINRLRNGVKDFSEDVLSRILNVMIPIQKMFIALMDTFQKIQGVMTNTLYTMLGSYYTLQALMGAILELIIKMLVVLVVIIVGLWILPFTYPAAASMTAVFVAIAVPLSIIIYFMTEVLHIKTSAIPKLRCFDENTQIQMLNGKQKFIKDVNVGDKLQDGSYITAKIKVSANNPRVKMFVLNNVIVSETHLVKYNDKWIRVIEHPNAHNINYHKPFLYCLNTSNKIIKLNNMIFSDWDEINDKNISILDKENKYNGNLENIHKYFDDGFEENTFVSLIDTINQRKEIKPIKEINIGDVLENGAIVYGLVEIDTRKLRKYDNIDNRPNKLHHILTNDGTFMLNLKNVKDYNNLIDKFII